MNENIKEKVEGYLELLDQINAKTEDATTAIVLLQEVAKDLRTERMIEEREARKNEPATAKQKKFMDDLGIDFPENLTKQEASKLIEEELGRNNNSL